MERKQGQEEGETSEVTIRALLDATVQSIIAVDAKEKIVLATGALEKMFGYRPAEIIGQPLEVLVPEAARKRHVEYRRAYFANMQTRVMGSGLSLHGRRKDGTIFPIDVGLSVMETPAGSLAVAFVSDTSQRMQMEQLARMRVEEVRALAASLMTAQEEERRRVSGLLHDKICQQLASLSMDMGGLLGEPLPDNTKRQLKALQTRIVKASEEARHIAYELHPSILDDLGVAASLKALCKEFKAQHTDIDLEFTDVVLPSSVPREVGSCLYRVARETLQNIAKHANATHIWVALSLEEEIVALSITDDGVGFDLEVVRGAGGLGLVGIEERVRLVNGKLSITTSPGHGTRIMLEIALAGPAG
jgi:PAS domain S-box-containing protein